MMNWEYDGFFRIGMHHRNERNAIVQHGTVSLISAKALRENGAWSEWCVCEDTELGLRLMHQGLTTVYVDNVVGRGLTPDGFAAFKKQRYRWAQGGMQILKAHADVLFGTQGDEHSRRIVPTLKPQLKPRLTSGQRYHFLAGWLPWFGDALHLVFALAAIAFTVSAIVLPTVVTLPTALFMLPLATFVLAKLVIGPLLYWRRVPCSFSNIVGASIAGMGVSHAIARGVFAGLLGKHARFIVTDKGQKLKVKQSFRTALAAWSCVTEEAFMMIALFGVAALLAFMPPIGIEKLVNGAALTNRRLWIAMLCLQALPYLSAIFCVLLSQRPERKQSISQNTVSHTFG
jgi:Glycosyl transferase family group 2